MQITTILLLCIAGADSNAGTSLAVDTNSGHFTARDGLSLYYSKYLPDACCGIVIYVTGITGLDSGKQTEFIDSLLVNGFGVYFLHPRGTGLSQGRRGDENIERFLTDYSDFTDTLRVWHPRVPFFLFGHSMSGAFAIEIAARSPQSYAGLIAVNPAFIYKQSKGAGPRFGDYVKYAFYYIFAPGALMVDMVGDSSLIEHPEDAKEMASRMNDSLVVKKFSMRYMAASKRIMNRCIVNARTLDLPLLLVYGEKDEIIEQSGHIEIYDNWKSSDKTLVKTKDGGHGYHVVVWSLEKIVQWLRKQTN